jgi:hypothetical protein
MYTYGPSSSKSSNLRRDESKMRKIDEDDEKKMHECLIILE